MSTHALYYIPIVEPSGVRPEEDRVNDGGREERQRGGGRRPHQRDEQIQTGDGRGEGNWKGRH